MNHNPVKMELTVIINFHHQRFNRGFKEKDLTTTLSSVLKKMLEIHKTKDENYVKYVELAPPFLKT